MSLCVFLHEWGWAGKDFTPKSHGPFGVVDPCNGNLWVMEKETLAVGSGGQSRDRSEHAPWPRQWDEEELSLQV